MRIDVKTTNEISEREWIEIIKGFNVEFGTEKTYEELLEFYRSTSNHYSYHAIAWTEDERIIGFTTIVPRLYLDSNNTNFPTGLSVSSFVVKEFRSEVLILHDLYWALRERLVGLGYKAILGVPNKNSVQYFERLLRFKFLFELNYYVLPIRIDYVLDKDFLKWVAGGFKLLVKLYVKLAILGSLLINTKERKLSYEIHFDEAEYKARFGAEYKVEAADSVRFLYRIYHEGKLRVAYIFDFREGKTRTLKALSSAVYFLVLKEEIDVIAFVGRLELTQCLLFKVPKGRVPKRLPLTIDLIGENLESGDIKAASADSWNFSLLNLDVR